jgi:phosphopantetheinyl transferase (holo-ACP synthase)
VPKYIFQIFHIKKIKAKVLNTGHRKQFAARRFAAKKSLQKKLGQFIAEQIHRRLKKY